ncbi:zinc finger BED domain-containing protein RICESLEEPER 2-like [Panicum virgatum]|uniref:zinc finger BED domain-containing protein RICESLEEPER 2-like n=1 Tax=Panicum virgatum TaxID=38727 RepID=UPI0019D575C3|nr:zinc finger BED domain-containing protein RICESLEEPER 2-like [Panicum virgatum]
MSSLQLEASGTSERTDNSSSQTPNRKEPIREYYEPELVRIDGALKAICKYCGTKLIANRKLGTNSLRTHIAEYCPKVPSDDRNIFVATMKKKPDGPFTFNKQRSRDLMIAWIVRADVAFNKFDDEGFEPWMESLQPTFSGIGRQTIRNDCVAKFERAKIELRSELQILSSRICFTLDLWTSNQKLGYLCVTAHYIGPDFVLKKKIITFKDVKYPHTGVAIEEAITTILTDYGIKEKMFTITLDNAANNKTTCDLLQESGKQDMLFGGEHLLVRCCAHILNILVQDGMNVASAVIELIRDLIRHINSSPARIRDFNEIAQRDGLAAKAGLVLDVPNRWNSTYAMIMEAAKYKTVLKRYATTNQQPFPTESEFSKVEFIGEFLGVYEETTRAFSADRYPTSHMFLHNVLCIHQTLRSPEWHKDQKLDLLDFFYEKVCINLIDIEISTNMVKEWLHKYFKKYEETIGSFQKKYNIGSFELLSKTAPIQNCVLEVEKLFNGIEDGSIRENAGKDHIGHVHFFIMLSCSLAVFCNMSQYLCIGLPWFLSRRSTSCCLQKIPLLVAACMCRMSH